MGPKTPPRRRWELVNRRPRWGLTWAGGGLAAASLLALALGFLHALHPFLAVTDRVACDTLVMEGWLHPPAVYLAAEEFRHGHYARIITTGGPIPSGRIAAGTWADSGAYWLGREAIPAEVVHKAPAEATARDRTFHSGLGLKQWLQANAPKVRAVNVVTEGAHARRTRLLFEKALGEGYEVGIVATRNPEYDPDHWWRSSEGVRETLGEAIAYLYARLLFAR